MFNKRLLKSFNFEKKERKRVLQFKNLCYTDITFYFRLLFGIIGLEMFRDRFAFCRHPRNFGVSRADVSKFFFFFYFFRDI